MSDFDFFRRTRHIRKVNDIPLLLTLGDPNGLGPELVCRLFHEYPGRREMGTFCILGPQAALEQAVERNGGEKFWTVVEDPEHARGPGVFLFSPQPRIPFAPHPGKPEPSGGAAAGAALETAARLLMNGFARGIVTLPLNKAMLIKAGYNFPGHTEFLAEAAGLQRDEVCMHLCGDILRVSLVTTHPALRNVPELITKEKILRCIGLTVEFLRNLGLDTSSVAVCGLNPHAGESGAIGREEIDVIEPAVAEAQALGYEAFGPFPADTIFLRAARGEFAAVLAMYHDQGLAPLKLMHFAGAVNVTLGLPFVRTSVDHGTGYDLVGMGKADLGSLQAALGIAMKLLEKRG